MAALVANYGSDSSESEIEDFPVRKQQDNDRNVNFFESRDQDSDDNDEDTSNQDVNIKEDNQDRLPNPLVEPLPSASSSLGNQPGASVFVSQYHLAEKEKQSVLEKHVKLSATKVLTGKKVQICHKFKRGKCRFGNKCKYSHDIDNCAKQGQVVNIPFDQVTDPRTGTNAIPLFSERPKKPLPQPEFISVPKIEEADGDSYMSNMKRKKRAGLSESLVPSKKALSSLNKQRETERPWTVTKK